MASCTMKAQSDRAYAGSSRSIVASAGLKLMVCEETIVVFTIKSRAGSSTTKSAASARLSLQITEYAYAYVNALSEHPTAYPTMSGRRCRRLRVAVHVGHDTASPTGAMPWDRECQLPLRLRLHAGERRSGAMNQQGSQIPVPPLGDAHACAPVRPCRCGEAPDPARRRTRGRTERPPDRPSSPPGRSRPATRLLRARAVQANGGNQRQSNAAGNSDNARIDAPSSGRVRHTSATANAPRRSAPRRVRAIHRANTPIQAKSVAKTAEIKSRAARSSFHLTASSHGAGEDRRNGGRSSKQGCHCDAQTEALRRIQPPVPGGQRKPRSEIALEEKAAVGGELIAQIQVGVLKD